jgi:hypothetical protein
LRAIKPLRAFWGDWGGGKMRAGGDFRGVEA